MTKKLSYKDKKDWEKFINSSEKLKNKDSLEDNKKNIYSTRSIDLHGYTLDQANKKITKFIEDCYLRGINKINIITGKGLRSKNIDNPYQSKDLSILKFSVPNYIKNNPNLMDKIVNIDFDSINSFSSGSFDVVLKLKKK